MNEDVKKLEEALRESFIKIKKLNHQVEQLESLKNEPIAIIGIGCRLPGSVNSPEDFWELLIKNQDAIIETPSDRWNVDQYYDPNKEAPGKMYVRKGGFLQTPIDTFDADFFHISPREAQDMDPQQRLALEVAQEAIENAGINPKDIKGSQTGVYMGICLNEYRQLITESGNLETIGSYYSTGNHYSVLSGRISYYFGLEGPAISMDTACSSSLVTLDAAVKDLRLKRCHLALTGGVNLILSPETTINFCKAGMLSPEGKCKTFDADANGYVRGEGCGILVLKRLSDAIADNNTILALIRGTAVNQDGASSGLTVPNGLAQEQVIKQALNNAKIPSTDISYVEAHGTGTSLGDPIELEALVNTYSKGREKNHPLFVGSVKTNIGHTEAVAGVVSIIKVVLSLLHEKIPATLHFTKLNPNVDLSNVPLEIATKNIDWKRGAKRLAGISSFGFSGTNAHVILEEGPHLTEQQFAEWEERSLHRHLFNRQHFWVQKGTRGRKLESIHPLLGEKINLSNGEIVYQNEINLSTVPYLIDHQVYENIIFPGAAYIEMLVAAAHHGTEESEIQLGNISIEAALKLAEGQSIRTQVLMNPADDGYEISICSQIPTEKSWICHAKGNSFTSANKNIPSSLDLEKIKFKCPTNIDKADFYSYVNSTGLDYGKHFQALSKIYVGEKEALAELKLSDIPNDYLMHPALLDGALQLLAVKLFAEKSKDLYLPIGCETVEFYSPLKKELFAYFQETENREISNITLCGADGKIFAKLIGMQYRKTTEHALKQMLSHESNADELLYEWLWEEKSLEEASIPNGHWLILSDGKISESLNVSFAKRGATCHVISAENLPQTQEEFVCLIQGESFDGILHVASTGHPNELSTESIRKWQNLGTKSLLHLIQALVKLEESKKIPLFIVTEKNLTNSPILGFFKTAIVEHPELAIKLIDLGADWNQELLLKSIFDKSSENLLSLKNNRCYVPRFLKYTSAKAKRHELIRPVDDQFSLQSKSKGLLENLTLAPLQVKSSLSPHEVEVDVRAVGLNFRDVLDALGLYPGDPGPLGGDGAGIITRVGEGVKDLKPGDSVLGMMSGSLARKTQVHRDNITLKPNTLDFAHAAALPTVFLTTYYAFTRSTSLKKNETVLIHAGAGGVGQAAIQLAQWIGANIIVTAGSEEKRQFLKSQGIQHVFDSRSLTYGKEIEALTQGQGVDVVLNSLSGEGFIETTVGICKKGARFLEIGKRDIWSKEKMKNERPDIDYHIIALDDISQKNPEIIQQMLKELMPLFEQEILKPLPITLFPIEEAIQAFEYMQTAKQIGKVVIEIPPALNIEDKIRPDATYLITGGLGGLGLTLSKWLSDKGATHLVLTGRRELDDEIQSTLKNIETATMKISYETLDSGDEKSVEKLLNTLQGSEKPLKGIFHLAGVLEDATLMEQEWDHFEKVFRPKVYGSFYLHHYSKNLNLFVTFSSIASSLGNPGQSNYAAANAFMDELCHYRQQKNLPALSLSWGPWEGVGMAKDLVSRHATAGLLSLTSKEALSAFEKALLSSQPHLTIANINWKNYLNHMIEPSPWFKSFLQEKQIQENLFAKIEAAPLAERETLLKSFVMDVVRSVLGFPPSQQIDEEKGFFDMGLDSLLAVELKNRLQVGLGKNVTLGTTAVFNHSSIHAMVNHIASLLNLPITESKDKKEMPKSDKIKEAVSEMSIDDIMKELKSGKDGK